MRKTATLRSNLMASPNRRFAPLGFIQRHKLRTATIVLLVALAVAGNAVAFGTLKQRLFPSFPYPDSGRLYQVYEMVSGSKRLVPSSLGREIVGGVDLLDGGSVYDIEQVMVTYGDESRMTVAQSVSPDFFRILGATPATGRLFSDSETSASVAVLQHDLWTKLYGDDPDLSDQTVVLNGKVYDAIGVMPEGFSFLTPNTEVWLPLDAGAQEPERPVSLVVRAAPGVAATQLESAITAVASGAGWTVSGPGSGFSVRPLSLSDQGPRTRQIFSLLQVSMLGVLLLSSINVGIVQLADTQRRLKEIGTRLLLGGTRASVARLLWLENLAQATLGGLLGIVLALGAVRVLRKLPSFSSLPEPLRPDFDLTVLGASLGFVLLISIVAGVIPVFQALGAGGGAMQTLNSRQGQTSARRRILRGFVGAQIAIALLLVSVGLLTSEGLRRIARAPSGIDGTNVLMMGMRLPEERYPDPASRISYFERVTAALAQQPAVERVALATSPLRLQLPSTTVIDPTVEPRTELSVGVLLVTSTYFETAGMRTRLGGHDRAGQSRLLEVSTSVAVNEKLAELLWSGDDPVGRTLLVNGETRQVTGVVANALHDLGSGSPGTIAPVVYGVLAPGATSPRILHVRAKNLSAATRRTLEETIRKEDPVLALPPLFTLKEQLQEVFRLQRLAESWLWGYALLALLLSAAGVFSVTASSAAQRQHEMGVRLALGATPRSNLLETMRDTAAVTLVAIGVGLPVSFLAGRLLSRFLVGLESGFSTSLLASTAAIAITALLASLAPALRVMACEPAEVLRAE